MVPIGAMNHGQPEERDEEKEKKHVQYKRKRETTASRVFFGKHSGTPVLVSQFMKITCLVIYSYMSFIKKNLRPLIKQAKFV